MQKLMYINDDNLRPEGTNTSIESVNELLAEGWKVVKITCSNETNEGGIGGFVVLEKEEVDRI